jgi:hypothetical protein
MRQRIRHRKWRVKRIDVEAGGRVSVTLAMGTSQFRFPAPDFTLSQPAGAAALARFVAKTGLDEGSVRDTFVHLSTLPADYVGVLPVRGLLRGLYHA